jgi:hypothetical protein
MAVEPDPNLELLAAMVYDLAERLSTSVLEPHPADDAAWVTRPEPPERLLAVVHQAAPALVDLCMLLRAAGARLAATPEGDPDDPGGRRAAGGFRAAGAGLRQVGDLLDQAYGRLVEVLHDPDLTGRLAAGGRSGLRGPIPGRVPQPPDPLGGDPARCPAGGGHLPDPRTVRWTDGYQAVHVNCRRCGRCGSIRLPRGDELDWRQRRR